MSKTFCLFVFGLIKKKRVDRVFSLFLLIFHEATTVIFLSTRVRNLCKEILAMNTGNSANFIKKNKRSRVGNLNLVFFYRGE